MCRSRLLLLFRSSSKASCSSEAESQHHGPDWGVGFNFTLLFPIARRPESTERSALAKQYLAPWRRLTTNFVGTDFVNVEGPSAELSTGIVVCAQWVVSDG